MNKDICWKTIEILEDEGFDCSEIDKDNWNLIKGNCCIKLTRMFTITEAEDE